MVVVGDKHIIQAREAKVNLDKVKVYLRKKLRKKEMQRQMGNVATFQTRQGSSCSDEWPWNASSQKQMPPGMTKCLSGCLHPTPCLTFTKPQQWGKQNKKHFRTGGIFRSLLALMAFTCYCESCAHPIRLEPVTGFKVKASVATWCLISLSRSVLALWKVWITTAWSDRTPGMVKWVKV